jgi:BRCA2, oligonucleotide/oligosaccharide-binding, domain 1
VELNCARKPHVRAILQGDTSSEKPMVLTVARLFPPTTTPNNNTTNTNTITSSTTGNTNSNNTNSNTMSSSSSNSNTMNSNSSYYMAELTDGWYPVDATLDGALSFYASRGRIAVGALSGAVLSAGSGSSDVSGAGGTGVDPLRLVELRAAGQLPPGAAPSLQVYTYVCTYVTHTVRSIKECALIQVALSLTCCSQM